MQHTRCLHVNLFIKSTQTSSLTSLIDRGQGLNNALQDASNLVDALTENAARGDLRKAIDAYEVEMRERAGKEVHISKEQATKVSNWKTLMDTPMVRLGMKRQADVVAATSVEEVFI